MRPPKTQATTDPKAVAEEVVHDVLAILRAHGVKVPLAAMGSVAAAVEEKFGGKKSNHHQPNTLAPEATQ